METDRKTEDAVHKYGLIAPLLHIRNEADRDAVVRSIEGGNLEIPNSSKHSLCRRTVRNYLKRYREKGLSGLTRKKRKDSGLSTALPEAVQAKIKELKQEDPKRTVPQIIRLVHATPGFEECRLAERTVSRFILTNGLTRKSLLPKKVHLMFEAEKINALWQSDITDGIMLRGENRMTYLFAFIDDHSRLVPHAEFYMDEKSPRLEDCLKKAILKRGIPEALYVDNGKVFDSNHLKRICAELGIRLLHHLPYSPQSKGKIERFFQRAQKEFMTEARFADIQSLPELNSFWMTWLEMEYHRKEHHAIGTTPLERYHTGMKTLKPRTVESMEDITEIFLYRETRSVHHSTGIIKLDGNIYQCHNEFLLGRKVDLRYDPFDMSRIFVYFEGAFSECAYPVSLKNPVYRSMPEENRPEQRAVRQSSVEFFSRLKQKESEVKKAETHRIDYAKLNNSRTGE